MKKINLEEIKEIFDKLLMCKISRENASSWALELQNSQDSELLEYTPASDEMIIWESIQYLVGVDSMDEPGVCLHNCSDIEDFRKQLLK